MDPQTLKDLLDKYTSGTASTEELDLLESWYLKESAKATELTTEEVILAEQMMSERIQAHLGSQVEGQIKKIHHKATTWLSAAAILALIISCLWASMPFIRGMKGYQTDVSPGRSGATLTLGDGRQVVLSNVIEGEVARESGVVVKKLPGGLVEYVMDDKQTGKKNMNTLSTARGETYRVRLPDGTAVWLNAASSLKFPVSFKSAKHRRVELRGEGYFEVFKNQKQPFIVSTAHQEIEVLGTHFNVNSYNEDPDTRTTLIEGSVKVRALNHNVMDIVLKPGQTSVLAPEKFKILNIDAEQAFAWKDGDFMFKNEHIMSIMQKLSRWYDIEVSYEGDMSDLIFIGVVSRSKNISAVLKIMESTGNVHFTIEGRRVTVRR